MNFTKKLLALLLFAAMCIGMIPAAIATTGSTEPMDNAKQIEELLDFSNRLHEMTEKYTPTKARANYEDPYANARIIVKSAQALDYEGALSYVNGHNDLHIIQYATAEEAEKACNAYSKIAGVEYAEPDRIFTIAAEPGSDEFLSWGFGENYVDAFDYNEWILDYSGSLSALPSVVVAVIDTGADSDHPFIMDRLVAGYDFENNDSNPEDDHYHGTHVAGTVVDGTLSNVSIMPLKTLDSEGYGDESKIALAMEYAYLNGADVVNMSLRGHGYSTLYAEAINTGAEYGTVYCVASGNDSGNANNYCPGNVERAITVAAVDSNNSMAYFSNTGDIVDISAPGVGIRSAAMGGGYRELDGTSMATPHVAAVAAMIKSYDVNMSVDDVTNSIKSSASLPILSGGGAGMLCARDMFRFSSVVNAEGNNTYFTSSGTYPWVVENGLVHSGNAGVNSSSSVITARSAFSAYQIVSFNYKVSGDAGDFLKFYVDDELILNVSGEIDWVEFTYMIGEPGSHLLSWEFVKDGSGAAGSDCAWIDEFAVIDTISSVMNTGNGNFLFETSGQYPWIIDGDAAKSGNNGVSGTVSDISTTVANKEGLTFVFDYKVAPGTNDKFQFIVNGQTVLDVGATTDWTEYEYTIPTNGSYELGFRYIKNSSGTANDAAWVKNVDIYYTLEYALNVDGGRLDFDTSPAYPWIVENDYAKSGNNAVHSSESFITLVIDMEQGDTLSFSYRVSSESNYDFFKFHVNGTQTISASGEISWTDYTYTAAASGTYTFRWSYTKDGSVNSREDAAFLDNVAVTGTSSTIPGDCNDSGGLDTEDCLLAIRYYMQLIDESQLNVEAADFDGDGFVTTKDALDILRSVLSV